MSTPRRTRTDAPFGAGGGAVAAAPRDAGPDAGRGVAPAVAAGALAALAAVAALAYSSFLAAPWAHSRLPVTRSLVSELETTGQPFSGLFRHSDVVSGAAMVALAVLAARLLPRCRATLVGCTALATVGVASMADARDPMTCAPSVQPTCVVDETSATGLLRDLAQPHTVSGLVGFFGAAAAMVFLAAAGRGRAGRFPSVSATCAAAIGLIGLADVPLMLTSTGVGVAERLRVLLISAWLLALGAELARRTMGGALGPLAEDDGRADIVTG